MNSQIAFVGCGQGIALVPSRFEKLAPASVAFRPLEERIEVVTSTLAWSDQRKNPLVDVVVAIVAEGVPHRDGGRPGDVTASKAVA